MGRTTKSKAFHFCKTIALLLATCSATSDICNACELTCTYLAYDSGIVRKRRIAKPKEVVDATRPPRRTQVVFNLGKGRTAKHKSASWTTDSGATVSVTNRLDIFETIDDVSPNVKVRVANGHTVSVQCIGTVRLNMVDSSGKPYAVLLSNVFYSPDFSSNLLSVHEMYRQHRISTVFRGNKASFVTADDVEIPITFSRDRQYLLQANAVVNESALCDALADLWHSRLMHCGNAALRRMACVIPALKRCKFDFSKCDACLSGAGRKLPISVKPRASPDSSFRRKPHKFTYFGERIASDLCGPFPTGLRGEKYTINFYDCHTKYIKLYCLPNKEKLTVLNAFKQFLADHQHILLHGIGEWWTDNGGEFLNKSMDAFCEELCVKRAFSIPYEPRQNPYAERANGTVLRPMRSMFAASGAPEHFWPDVARHAALVHNVLKDDQCNSPYETVHGKAFDYDTLHNVLCLCYYLLPERDRASKLSPRALPARYLGVDPIRHGHIVYVPGLQRYTSAYHVVFNEYRYYDVRMDKSNVTFGDREPSHTESHRLRSSYNEERDHSPGSILPPSVNPQHGTLPTDGDPGDWNAGHCSNSACLYPNGHDGLCSHQEVYAVSREHPRRLYPECSVNQTCMFHAGHCGECMDDSDHWIEGHTSPTGVNVALHIHDEDYYSSMDYDCTEESFNVIIDNVTNEAITVNAADFSDIPCPNKYEDTQSSPLKLRWNESMREEWEALIKNETFEFVSHNDPRVRGRKPTKSRWVYTIKYNRDGTISRYKSRFVVCGYSQRQGIDYDRAFSATLRATSFRTLLSIAAGKKMRLMQLDVSNAFTQAEMDDADVYIEAPKGNFGDTEVIRGKVVSKLLYLKRALYGTKQASRLWQNTLREFLVSLGFQQSTADPCVFRLVIERDEIILGIYVDDILVAYRGNKFYETFSAKFFARFPGKQEPLRWFLGMAIDQHEDYSIHVNHELSISKLGDKYIPGNIVTRDHPSLETFNKLDKAVDNEDRARVQARSVQYASLVGALLYISVMSRPDIAVHTSILAKFLADPSSDCCDAAIILTQYLYSTRRKKLYYSGKVTVPDGLEKHGVDIERNFGFVAYSDSSWGNKYPYPMFGYCVYLYGGLISFASKQLKTIAFSSCEAEYAAASFACKEVEFIRMICSDMGVELRERLVLGVDNTAAIDIAHDVGVSGRTKHYSRAIHYLRDLTQLKRILPAFVNTFQQRADGYTKVLDKSTFLKWVTHVMSA